MLVKGVIHTDLPEPQIPALRKDRRSMCRVQGYVRLYLPERFSLIISSWPRKCRNVMLRDAAVRVAPHPRDASSVCWLVFDFSIQSMVSEMCDNDNSPAASSQGSLGLRFREFGLGLHGLAVVVSSERTPQSHPRPAHEVLSAAFYFLLDGGLILLEGGPRRSSSVVALSGLSTLGFASSLFLPLCLHLFPLITLL